MTMFSKPKTPDVQLPPAPCARCGAAERTTRVRLVATPDAASNDVRDVWLCAECLATLRRGAKDN